MDIRPETATDRRQIYAVNAAAFPGEAEAMLVDKLRQEVSPFLSLVAVQGETVVGHILFTPVTLSGHEQLKLMGLAPMAVLPERQKQGIGKALIEAGLRCCEELDAGAVVVLGHPEYYPRFGFRPAVEFNIRSAFEVPDDSFLIKLLQPGYLDQASGTIRYHCLFDHL